MTDIQWLITLEEEAKTRMYDGIPLEQWKTLNIPLRKINSINDEYEWLKTQAPDFIFMTGWRQIVEPKILDLPKKGVIAFHPSLLPKGRGPAPIINSILLGVKESGVTMYYAAEGLDNGDIIGQEHFRIDKNDYAENVYNKVVEAGKKLIKQYLPLLLNGKAPRIPQQENQATFFPRRTEKDNEILETDSLETIKRKIRAFSRPYNGAFMIKNGVKKTFWEIEDYEKATQ